MGVYGCLCVLFCVCVCVSKCLVERLNWLCLGEIPLLTIITVRENSEDVIVYPDIVDHVPSYKPPFIYFITDFPIFSHMLY